MSIKLMGIAWENQISQSAKLVMLALCDSADDTTHECFPSLATLSKKASVSKTTLSYILRVFEHIGNIKRKQRHRENGADTSTIYTVLNPKVDTDNFKKEYQKIKGYKPTSQCEQPLYSRVNTISSQSGHPNISQSEHPSPSQGEHPIQYINRQYSFNPQLLGKIPTSLENIEAFIQHRSKINKPMTDEALKRFGNQLRRFDEKGYDVDLMIDEAIINNWQSLVEKDTYLRKDRSNMFSSKVDKKISAIDEWKPSGTWIKNA